MVYEVILNPENKNNEIFGFLLVVLSSWCYPPNTYLLSNPINITVISNTPILVLG